MRFADDFHSWLRHLWKSSANRLTRDPKIVIHGNSCIILYMFTSGNEWLIMYHTALLNHIGLDASYYTTIPKHRIIKIVLHIGYIDINSLQPSSTTSWHWAGLTLAQVMADCLTARSLYLNQCGLIISKVQRYSSEDKFPRETLAISH